MVLPDAPIRAACHPRVAGSSSQIGSGAVRTASAWPTDLTFFGFSWNDISSTIWVGVIGLGLSEAAYMAEIARAGILSVDKGQDEAARALGMSSGQRMDVPRRCGSRPPTGNETIAMVKDTSLLTAVPVLTELYYQAYLFGQRGFKIIPFVAATLWYLIC
ncbi:MAG: ABC transporter permease subunit [Actinomycetales bacterium]|nr:ABC transporter permease subunit [Actinomycetales bacterium]